MLETGVFIQQQDPLPEGAARYRPRPDAIIEAVEMHQPFVVEMRGGAGVVTGKPGDFLVRGTDGELYPCIREVFLRKYEAA